MNKTWIAGMVAAGLAVSGGAFAGGDAAKGKEKAAVCTACHGPDGNAPIAPEYPRLAGQHAQYTERQLKAFNQRERTNDNAVMHSVAVKLTELELKAVASYISGLK